MKHTVRSYALGLLTAAAVIAITYWNTNSPSTEIVEKEMSKEQMISQLEDEGYRIITTEEWDAVTENKKNKDSEAQEDTQPNMTTFSIDIVSGTTTDEISEKLVQAGIIKDARAFETFMKENDYSRYIQIGQATLNSEMTLKEIAAAITSK